MTDREATECCNDWHGGKRAAFGKRRQRGLREGRAAMGGKGLGQGDRDGTQQTLRGMMTGAVGSKQLLGHGGSGDCGQANRKQQNAGSWG